MNFILYRILERKKRTIPQELNATRKVNRVGREVDIKSKYIKLVSKEIYCKI